MLLRLLVTLHVVAAALYVGGSVFLELIFNPSQKFIPPSQASVIGQKVGRRFAVVAWTSLLVIGATGGAQFYMMGMMNRQFLSSRMGYWTLSMIALWVVLAINGAIMTLSLQPQLEGKLAPTVKPEDGVRKLAELTRASTRLDALTRINAVASILALAIGASLRYGGLF
jgi:uncharacterized membrane protein